MNVMALKQNKKMTWMDWSGFFFSCINIT